MESGPSFGIVFAGSQCGRTVSSAEASFSKHQVKQPHLCKPTNHPSLYMHLCRPNVVRNPALPAVYTDQTFSRGRERSRHLAGSLLSLAH